MLGIFHMQTIARQVQPMRPRARIPAPRTGKRLPSSLPGPRNRRPS